MAVLGALAMHDSRLQQQLEFLVEIDKLKSVLRQTPLMDGSRRENDAEHSWHLAMMALVLGEYANQPGLDLLQVVKMVLIHDLVEIDAGDTFCYDRDNSQAPLERELAAAERIYPLLPPEQAAELHALWLEFEARETPEARFAAALDRLQPLLHNQQTQGEAWRRHGISREQVVTRNRHIEEGSRALWECAREIIDEACQVGWLKPN